ncbi:hypothetical protein MESS4_750136 [Mesorhizobium sp. STM 4661]|nr:hypothetical protein MESS4_750136 [Mesorhizobium sp. STM 4661]
MGRRRREPERAAQWRGLDGHRLVDTSLADRAGFGRQDQVHLGPGPDLARRAGSAQEQPRRQGRGDEVHRQRPGSGKAAHHVRQARPGPGQPGGGCADPRRQEAHQPGRPRKHEEADRARHGLVRQELRPGARRVHEDHLRLTGGISHMDSCEEDPHPDPPHKGEGKLPRALLIFMFNVENFGNLRRSAPAESPWGGVRGGGIRRAKASISHMRLPRPDRRDIEPA